MIYESTTQPYAALIFILGGGGIYILYEVFQLIRKSKRLLIVAEILDAIWGVAAGVCYIFITHFLYFGKIKYFTIFSYLLGIVLARLVLKRPLRQINTKIFNLYKSKINTNTNDIKKEDRIMAEKNQNNKQNKQNKQNNKQQKNNKQQNQNNN